MKNLNPNDPNTKCFLITHVVSPHQFYFKYTNDSVNSEFSNFDFEVQLYGNKLHSQKTHENGYLPAENELVIFFHVIFNKWVRGRVVSIGKEITLWCIDSGICEKCAVTHVLPLTSRFHEDMKLVHLGGLSLLPTEKILNVSTVEVETNLAKQWDPKTITYFKGILNTSKTLAFTEEFELSNHKFGLLTIESKSAQSKDINNILVEMNNVASSYQYADEDLRSYVCTDQVEKQLYQSLINGSTMQTTKGNNNCISKETLRSLSIKFGSEMSSIDGDFYETASRQSSDAAMLDIETKSGGSFTTHRSEHPKAIVSISNTLPIRAAEEASSRVGNLDGKCNDNFDGSVKTAMRSTTIAATAMPSTTIDATTAGSSLSTCYRPNGADYECFLRTCQSEFSKELRRPLESTKELINSAPKSDSSASTDNIFLRDKPYARSNVNVADNRRTQLFSPTLFATNSSTAPISRRNMLANLAEKESTTESTKIVNNVKSSINHFGVPAGYAKNRLDTFGGFNIK